MSEPRGSAIRVWRSRSEYATRVLDEPTDLPERLDVSLVLADGAEMSDEQRAAVNESLDDIAAAAEQQIPTGFPRHSSSGASSEAR